MAKLLVESYGGGFQRLTLYGETTAFDVLLSTEKFLRAHPDLTKRGVVWVRGYLSHSLQTLSVSSWFAPGMFCAVMVSTLVLSAWTY